MSDESDPRDPSDLGPSETTIDDAPDAGPATSSGDGPVLEADAAAEHVEGPDPDAPPPVADTPADPGQGWRAVLILALATVAVVHSVVIALFLAPDGPVRDAAGPSRLSFYVNPYFQQSWDVLEPSAQRVDESLEIRARVRVDEETVEETGWIDVTAADLRTLRLNAAPDRMSRAARRLATNLNGVMFELGIGGRAVVGASTTDGEGNRVAAGLADEGVDPLLAGRFVRLDTMLTRFASLYARASLDDPVVEVQYRVGRRVVPPREDRDDVRVGDVEFGLFTVGWRPAVTTQEREQRAFDTWVKGD